MDIKLFFALLATSITVFSFIDYIKDIRGKVIIPDRATWLIWTILQAIAVMAGLSDGGGYGLLDPLVGSVFCFIIFILSLQYEKRKIPNFDIYCLIASVVILIFYGLTGDALLSVILVAIVDAIGFLPTIKKGWERPNSEVYFPYMMFAIGYLLDLFALEHYSLTTSLYIVESILANMVFLSLLFTRRYLFRKR